MGSQIEPVRFGQFLVEQCLDLLPKLHAVKDDVDLIVAMKAAEIQIGGAQGNPAAIDQHYLGMLRGRRGPADLPDAGHQRAGAIRLEFGPMPRQRPWTASVTVSDVLQGIYAPSASLASAKAL